MKRTSGHSGDGSSHSGFRQPRKRTPPGERFRSEIEAVRPRLVRSPSLASRQAGLYPVVRSPGPQPETWRRGLATQPRVTVSRDPRMSAALIHFPVENTRGQSGQRVSAGHGQPLG